MPPEWDVNLFILRAGGRGAGGDVAVQGLILGSASVCLCVCLCACPHWVWWVVGERVSGQGPDQTVQESETYNKILRKKDPPLTIMRTALPSNHHWNVLFERPLNPIFDLASLLAVGLP